MIHDRDPLFTAAALGDDGTDAIILDRTHEIVDKQTAKTKRFTMFKLLLYDSDLYDVAP